ncbi:MAG TPA: DUF4402 domain-containing protein, partial [Gammaproteobacteria bacterium]
MHNRVLEAGRPSRGARRILVAVLVALPAIATALTVTSTQEISFGAIVVGPAGGTVTVTYLGSRSCSVDVTCLPQSPAYPARFTVSGDPFMSFGISLPVSATLSDGAGNSMLIDGFEDSLGGTGTLGSAGQANFAVGAALHVEPGQAASSYSGSFNV